MQSTLIEPFIKEWTFRNLLEFLRNEGLAINAGIFGYFNRNSSDNILIKEYYKVNPTSKQIVSNVIFDDSLPQMYVFCNCQY